MTPNHLLSTWWYLDSGRNALTDISKRFIVWWWRIWQWLIVRRCLVIVYGCRVLVPPRSWRVAVALRGSVVRGQNLCLPGCRNKADACLVFRCHGDVQVFSMTLFITFMLIDQTVLNYNAQWQLHVHFICVVSNKRFMTSDFLFVFEKCPTRSYLVCGHFDFGDSQFEILPISHYSETCL